jgi:superfamily II DNA/RNA helicase
MQSPERVSVGATDQPVVKIKQTHVSVDGKDKNAKILEILKTRTGSILVFARTKMRTDRLARFLKGEGVKCGSIHGGRTQSQRQQALEGFRDGYYPVLVATDVAARGLDIPQIELVINFDLPETGEDYIHRIGRTARAGASGEAMSFVTPDEMRFFKSLSQPTGQTNSTHQRRGGPRSQNSQRRSKLGYGQRSSSRNFQKGDRPSSFGGQSDRGERSTGSRFGGNSQRGGFKHHANRGPKRHSRPDQSRRGGDGQRGFELAI